MNILQIEDFFHPDAGYQINILSKYLSKFGHKVTIITSEYSKAPSTVSSFFSNDNIADLDAKFSKETNVDVIRLPVKCFISNRAIFTKALKKTVRNLKADVLFVHGNDTVAGLWAVRSFNKNKIPLIMDSHMLAMASKNKFHCFFAFFYRLFFTNTIVKNNIKIIRTQNDDYIFKTFGIPNSLSPWISYGSDLLLFHPNLKNKEEFKKKYNLPENSFIIVYAGKLDESKGGKMLGEAFLDKFNTPREIVLVVVGNCLGDYGKEVEMLFNNSKNRVIRFPTQKYVDLPYYFQIADLSVFPKQCSLSFYDAQACGLPVLSENNNVNLERCSHHNGWNFSKNDKEDFRRKIEELISMPSHDFERFSKSSFQYIKDNFDYEQKAREYEKIIIQTVDSYWHC